VPRLSNPLACETPTDFPATFSVALRLEDVLPPTWMVAVPEPVPAPETFAQVVEPDVVQEQPADVETVTLPATVSDVLRPVVPFDVTVTVAVPDPDPLPVTFAQEDDDDDVQPHPAGAVTLTVAAPDAAPKLSEVGETL
jgi:hypothetical protein